MLRDLEIANLAGALAEQGLDSTKRLRSVLEHETPEALAQVCQLRIFDKTQFLKLCAKLQLTLSVAVAEGERGI